MWGNYSEMCGGTVVGCVGNCSEMCVGDCSEMCEGTVVRYVGEL